MAFNGNTAEANEFLVGLIISPVPSHYTSKKFRSTLINLGVPDNDIRKVFKYDNQGFGIAKFPDRQVAQIVMHILKNQIIEGKIITVKYTKASGRVEQVLYVTNFPSNCGTAHKVKTLLEHNDVKHIACVQIINKPKEKLYAYVAFNLQVYARQALDRIDGAIMGGTKLKALTCSKHLQDSAMPQVTIAGGSTDLDITHFPRKYNTNEKLKANLELLGARNIVEVRLLLDGDFKYTRGFVSFLRVEDAEAALKILDGYSFGGHFLHAWYNYSSSKISDKQKSTATDDASTTLFISNVSSKYGTNDEFKGKLELVGAEHIDYVRVFRVTHSGVFEGSLAAFAAFQTVEDATEALDVLHGAIIDGRRIKVQFSYENAYGENLLPASPPTAPTTCPYLHVTNVPEAYGTDDKLKILLDRKDVRNIVSVQVAIDQEERLYAYVSFKNEEEARQASERAHGLRVGVNKTLEAYLIVKNESVGYPGVAKDLHVSNFGEAYGIDYELRKLLELLGVTDIASVRVIHEPDTKLRACVTFYNELVARQALRTLEMACRPMEEETRIKAKLMSEYLKDLAMEKLLPPSLPTTRTTRLPASIATAPTTATRASVRARDPNDEKYYMPRNPPQPPSTPGTVTTAAITQSSAPVPLPMGASRPTAEPDENQLFVQHFPFYYHENRLHNLFVNPFPDFRRRYQAAGHGMAMQGSQPPAPQPPQGVVPLPVQYPGVALQGQPGVDDAAFNALSQELDQLLMDQSGVDDAAFNAVSQELDQLLMEDDK